MLRFQVLFYHIFSSGKIHIEYHPCDFALPPGVTNGDREIRGGSWLRYRKTAELVYRVLLQQRLCGIPEQSTGKHGNKLATFASMLF